MRDLKEAAAAVSAAVEILAKRMQAPQNKTIEEEMARFRKEIKELKYENRKMKAIVAQQQREMRERDEFPILRPSCKRKDNKK